MNKLIIGGLTMLILDSMFISIIAPLFASQISTVQGSPLRMNLLAAVSSYVFLIFGWNYFILMGNRSIKDAFLLGLVIYGTYETTSLALLRKWRLQTVIIDTLWGGILFASTTAIVYRLSAF